MTRARQARRRGTIAALCASGLALLALGPIARADAPEPLRSDFWRAVADPGTGRARELLRQARVIVRVAFPTGRAFDDDGNELERRVALDNALARLERARALAPRDTQVLWFRAELLARWRRRHGSAVERRDEEAIAAFDELRRVDPGLQMRDVAASLAELHTRRRDFAQAATEYQRAIRASLDERTSTVLWSNLGEMQMLSGDLDSAVASYQRSLDLARDGGDDSLAPALACWGLAIALDRLGEHRSAIDRATDAIGYGGGTLDVLRSPDVFFEPTYELFWYEALGHEALAAGAAANADVDLGRHPTAWDIEWLRAASRVLGPTEVAQAWGYLRVTEGDATSVPAAAEAFHSAVDELRRRHPGIRPAPPSGLAAQRALAVESWRRFFVEGGSVSPWARIARARLTTLIAELRGASEGRARATGSRRARLPARPPAPAPARGP